MTDVKILTKREVADILRLKSTTTVDAMIRRGEFFKGFRRGGRLVGWVESDVMEWLKNQRRQAVKTADTD